MYKISTLIIFSFIFTESAIYKNDFLFKYFNYLNHINFNNYTEYLNNNNLLTKDYNVKKITDPITKNTHLIHSQLHNGIEVFGKKARLHFNENNKISSFSNNFFDGEFNNSIPTININQLHIIINNDFKLKEMKIKKEKLIYFIKDDYAYLAYDVNAVSYHEGYRYIINAHTGDIIKKWTLVYNDGPTIGEGENLLGEWVDARNIVLIMEIVVEVIILIAISILPRVNAQKII